MRTLLFWCLYAVAMAAIAMAGWFKHKARMAARTEIARLNAQHHRP